MAYELVTRHPLLGDAEVGVFFPTLADALELAGPHDEVWQVADDAERTRVCRHAPPAELEPGVRDFDGRRLYSAAWL